VREKLIELRWRAAGHYSQTLPVTFTEPLRGANALEIGGPSAVFGADGLLPIYQVLGGVDGVQWTAETSWHNLDPADGYCPEGTRRGDLHLVDDIDLSEMDDARYDVTMSSHVIEHLANPLRALAAWRRVSRVGGHLLLVAPHMSGTFDRRRALTPLSHMIKDLEQEIDEHDLTHLEETLRLHDRSRDAEATDDEAWAELRRRNASTRLLHHHTFTTPSLLALLDHAGLELTAVATRYPHDIYVLGHWPQAGKRVDNGAFLRRRRRSPFRSDRITAHDSAGRWCWPAPTGPSSPRLSFAGRSPGATRVHWDDWDGDRAARRRP
jgi:SAM-dependent methyltransferase